MMKLALRVLGSDWTRIGSGLAAYAAMALFLWPPELEGSWTSVDLALLIAALVAFLTWAAAELRQFNPQLSPHDIDLYEKIKAKITDNHVYFLKTYDMGGGPFENVMVNIYPEIAHIWLGARWEFNDRALQSKWSVTLVRMHEFSREIRKRLHATDANLDYLGVDKANRHTEEGGKRFEEDRNALNKAATATAVAEALDELDRIALPRVPE